MKDKLKHGKIKLRALEPEDIELLYEWENNMAIWEVSNTKAPYSKHILAQYLVDSKQDIYALKQLRLIIQNESDKAIGAIDLFEFEPYHLRAGIGILIHDEEQRKKGYASDTLEAISVYAMEVLGLKQLYANIAADNSDSILLFEKAGFKPIGRKKDWLKSLRGWKDELLYQKILC